MSYTSSMDDHQQPRLSAHDREESDAEIMASPSLSFLPSNSGSSTPAHRSRANLKMTGVQATAPTQAGDGSAINSLSAMRVPPMPLSPTNWATPKSQDATVRMMLAHMYRTGLREEWLHDNDIDDQQEGVFMMCATARNGIYAHPVDAETETTWVKELLVSLQASCAVVAKPASTEELLKYVPLHTTITLETGEEIPIVDDLSQVSMLAPTAGCLLVRPTGMAVSYGSAMDVLHMARQLDAALISVLYTYTMPAMPSSIHMAATAVQQEQQQRANEAQEIMNQQPDAQQRGWLSMLPASDKPGKEAGTDSLAAGGKEDPIEKKAEPVVLFDHETGETVLEPERTSTHMAALLTGFGVAINMVIMSLFARDIVVNTLEDSNYTRAVLLAAIIPRFFVAQYFCDHIVLILAQLMFPVSQMHRNTLYYSGAPSAPLPKDQKAAPLHRSHAMLQGRLANRLGSHSQEHLGCCACLPGSRRHCQCSRFGGRYASAQQAGGRRACPILQCYGLLLGCPTG